MDNVNYDYTFQAYEDDVGLGLTKLSDIILKGNNCTHVYGATADGDNGYAEFYYRIGLPRYNDSAIRADVYQ